MTTAADVLTSAEKWLGTTEQPPGSNNVPGVTDWYGLRGAWCAMWISRVFYDAGMPLPASTPKGFAWVSAGFDWFQRQGWLMFTDWRQARPGDLIAWEWGSTAGGYDHISMVWENDRQFVTIGGNERDRVKFEFFGAPGGAALFARPPFDPPPTQETDVPLTIADADLLLDRLIARPDVADKLAARNVDFLASPATNPGTVIDPGARSALTYLTAAVSRPDGTVDVEALATALADNLDGDIADELADELAKRLAS